MRDESISRAVPPCTFLFCRGLAREPSQQVLTAAITERQELPATERETPGAMKHDQPVHLSPQNERNLERVARLQTPLLLRRLNAPRDEQQDRGFARAKVPRVDVLGLRLLNEARVEAAGVIERESDVRMRGLTYPALE